MGTTDTPNQDTSSVAGVVTKDVRDRVASRLRSELDFEFDWVDVRRHTAGLDISWSGAPTEDEVRAVCASEGVGTQAALKRIRVWSCGQPHADRASAWAQHRLYGLEYVDGAIRADHLPELFTGDAHLLSLASSMITDIADCGCGHSTFEGVYSADLVSLVRSSDLSYSDCQDGEFRLCVTCGGSGRVLSLDSTPVSESECGDCWGGRTFDVSLPDKAAAYQSLLLRYADGAVSA